LNNIFDRILSFVNERNQEIFMWWHSTS